MEGYLYTYFLHFSLQLLICEGVFALQLPRRRNFWIRLIVMLAAYFAGGVGYVALARQVPDVLYPLAIFYYVILFCITLLMLYGSFDADFKEILFVGTAGYAVQHITYALTFIIRYLIRAAWGENAIGPWVNEIVFNLLFFILTGLLCYVLLVRPNAGKGELKKADGRMIALSLAVLFGSVVLSLFAAQLERRAGAICYLYAVLACTLGLLMQYDLSRRNKLETSNEMLEQLLHMEKQQHEIARENIDIINIKCHDLKYQISALRDMDNLAQRQESIEELERSVMIYDSLIKSGNDALDLVLTEKSLLCQKYKIKFSCIIDGDKLSFMSTSDIYALFSNALDNAIECVSREEEEKRVISLRVAAAQEMLFIHIDNYCPRTPVFAEGLPVTSKEDKAFHGYGTRSIQYIVRRYDGDLRMSFHAEQFNLDILFNRG